MFPSVSRLRLCFCLSPPSVYGTMNGFAMPSCNAYLWRGVTSLTSKHLLPWRIYRTARLDLHGAVSGQRSYEVFAEFVWPRSRMSHDHDVDHCASPLRDPPAYLRSRRSMPSEPGQRRFKCSRWSILVHSVHSRTVESTSSGRRFSRSERTYTRMRIEVGSRPQEALSLRATSRTSTASTASTLLWPPCVHGGAPVRWRCSSDYATWNPPRDAAVCHYQCAVASLVTMSNVNAC
ncbi:hypothetical protein L226DRAFT_81715 [Lentinus tigrinus ALCF2SS1-7]|uniref:uncharacterized protein n=1 Tax=Lentinus tigrinus ALCF2SS1-7 TaxID=1328758 RepID=UPI001165DC2A|nr:hypothetical protein L226DRAFT_81715 [Lentinus tigrinus ALCF2SS1-7]